MNALDAAEAILEQANTPLHYRELTRRILASGLWQTTGKTPAATINATIGKDIKTHGAASRFQRTAVGTFSLRKWDQPTTAVPKPTKTHKPRTRMSFSDAAEYILDTFADKRPWHYRDITAKILALDLVQTEGQTPEATLYAQILSENRRRERRGQPPRFVRHGKGLVSLRKWHGNDLGYQITRHNSDVSRKLHARLHAMDAAEFEALIALLLATIGFEDVVQTPLRHDGGIDVRGTLVVGDVIRTRMAVQVKRWKSKNVQAPVVQQVRGSLGTHEQGLIITTSDFSRGARVEAARPDAIPVALMNGKQLVDLLIENDIGIRRTPYDLIELDTDEETL